MKEGKFPGKVLEQKKKILSCPSHLHGILAPKKVIENEKSKKKLPSHMYDDFHVHLIETNLELRSQICMRN